VSWRAFFAVEVGEAARREAARLAGMLREAPGGDGVRWVRPEAYHLTVRFLGEIEPAAAGDLAARAAGEVAALAPFEVHLAGPGAFPSPRRARVIVLGLAPEEPLAALAAALERAVVAAGFEPETRSFKAHLTLGRVAGRRAPSLEGVAAPAAAPFSVSEVVLFRSVLGPGGSTYTPLERIALGGSLLARSSRGDLHGTQRTEP
jgi:2'-5' RNA ligase